ncbi:DUF488 family protein [Candidatus Gottesmanbacteria bacterium]|nr:DUF488 family protein [Candidatus Gottesmanbacteria bacterium]
MLKTKSVNSPIQEGDGLRILATRFRGRGLEKNRYDVWMASLGPSEKLLREFQKGKINWKEYARRYKDEIFTSEEIDSRNKTIKNHGQKFTLRLLQKLSGTGTITLLCHCDEKESHCHRHILKEIIENI